MCRILSMSEPWIFVNFRKNDRVLNIGRNAIMEGFWIFQDSEYAMFMRKVLHKVLNMPQYSWIMPYDRVLNMAGQRFTGFEISLRL